MVLRQAPSDVHHRHLEICTTMIAHPSAVRQDKTMPTTADLSTNCQIVARLSRASSRVTLHYLRHLLISHAMALLAHHSAFPAYRAVRLVTPLVGSHPTHSPLPLIPSWQEPGRLRAAASRSSPVPYSPTHSMDELFQAVLKVGHRAPDLIVHPTLAKAACHSFKACTFVNAAPKSRRNLTPRMTSGKLKASRRMHIQEHVS